MLINTWNLCGIKRFDRRKESLNKLKFRAKNSGYSNTAAGKAKAYQGNYALAGSIPIPQTGANEIFIPGFHPNPQVEFLIDKLTQQYEDEYLEVAETMKACSQLRFRELIAETVHEFSRMENFCRIFPARNSKLYDKFFSGQKPLNKILYKVFYTNEVIAYEKNRVEQSAHPVPSKANSLLAQQ